MGRPLWSYYIPLLYTYFSRLKTVTGGAAFLSVDAVMLVLVLSVGYGENPVVVVLMEVGFWSLYEIGYLINDLADAGEDRRIPASVSARLRMPPFCAWRISIFLLIVALCSIFEGRSFGLSYGAVSALVLALLIFHSSGTVRERRFGSVLTFTVLATYKYLPVMVPVVGWHEGMRLAATLFFSLGLSRVTAYTLRKYGPPDIAKDGSRYELIVQIACLTAFTPVILLAFYGDRPDHVSGPIVAWTYSGIIALIRYVGRWLRAPVAERAG